jgi:hypothetical protein
MLPPVTIICKVAPKFAVGGEANGEPFYAEEHYDRPRTLIAALVPLSAAPANADGQCQFVTRATKEHIPFGQGAYIHMKNWWNQCGNHAHARKFRIWVTPWTFRIRGVSFNCTARDDRGSVQQYVGELRDGVQSSSAWFPAPRRRMYYGNHPRGVCTFQADLYAAPDHSSKLVTRIGHP